MELVAHINDQNEKQTLRQHSCHAAEYAARCLSKAGLGRSAWTAGMLHDMGKATKLFNQYIKDENAVRGSVIHTFSGCRYILSKYNDEAYNDTEERFLRKLTSEIIACAIGSHHGLFDIINADKKSGFRHRIEKENICYEESVENFFSDVVDRESIADSFSEAEKEISEVFIKKLCKLVEKSEPEEQKSELAFYVGMLTRLILSAVIDGDRRDTAEFMNVLRYPEYPDSELQNIWDGCLQNVEERLSRMPAQSDIQKARRMISQQCRDFAEHQGKDGVIRLNVPTGGGKTLSSLRYALSFAGIKGKSRIIFTAPLLSILDQNAKVIRDFIQNDSVVLEHHSNIIQDGPEKDEDTQLSERDLLTENWNAPIIITTMVQLLNTMLSGKTSCIRRFAALCNSIIIIDEVQTVPSKMITEFNLAVNFLAGVCNTTVVLCSATQPCLERVRHPLMRDIRNMVPYDEKIWNAFKRTELTDAGEMSVSDLPDFAKMVIGKTDSLLIICNTKSEASELYMNISEWYGVNVYHLSAAMCMKHRRETLELIRESLDSYGHIGIKTICISTQVIEAGVDISFGSVIRICAGLDSMVQAAGRCNRNGENTSVASVYIVKCLDEKLTGLPDIKIAQDATVNLLTEFKNAPEMFANSLTSDESVKYYYQIFYKLLSDNYGEECMDYPIDGNTLYSLLSNNSKYYEPNICDDHRKFIMGQAFREAGGEFRVFDNDTYDVIVPYKKGKELITELQSQKAIDNLNYRMQLVNHAKEYTISVYAGSFKNLEKNGGVYPVLDGSIIVMKDEFYSDKLGYLKEPDVNSMEYLSV